MKKAIVVGAGLAGSYIAYTLGQKGYAVQVFEKRPDPRRSVYGSGRSINLVVSDRGWTAFKYAGIESEIRKITVPAYGRQIHDLEGNQSYFPYSIEGKAIHSISRSELNQTLVELAEKNPAISVQFEHFCTHIDFELGEVTFDCNGKTGYGTCRPYYWSRRNRICGSWSNDEATPIQLYTRIH